jgi:hypothetical protein
MLIRVPPIVRHRPNRKPPRRATGPTPPAAITVLAVTLSGVGGVELTWTFSAAVTLTGGAGANVPELENDIDGTGTWQSPTSCAQGTATTIVATYPDAPQEASNWRIQTAPSNVAESGDMTVPQSGTIS